MAILTTKKNQACGNYHRNRTTHRDGIPALSAFQEQIPNQSNRYKFYFSKLTVFIIRQDGSLMDRFGNEETFRVARLLSNEQDDMEN